MAITAENENIVCALTAGFAKLKSAGVVRLYLGGFSPRLFNVDELPKRTAVCCITQVKSTSSKVRIPTRASPSLHISGRDLMQDILTCAMGLDVHRDVIVACLARGELGTEPEIEIRSFSTLIPEMRNYGTGCWR